MAAIESLAAALEHAAAAGRWELADRLMTLIEGALDTASEPTPRLAAASANALDEAPPSSGPLPPPSRPLHITAQLVISILDEPGYWKGISGPDWEKRREEARVDYYTRLRNAWEQLFASGDDMQLDAAMAYTLDKIPVGEWDEPSYTRGRRNCVAGWVAYLLDVSEETAKAAASQLRARELSFTRVRDVTLQQTEEDRHTFSRAFQARVDAKADQWSRRYGLDNLKSGGSSKEERKAYTATMRNTHGQDWAEEDFCGAQLARRRAGLDPGRGDRIVKRNG